MTEAPQVRPDSPPSLLQRLQREPLLLFLALGLAVFLIERAVGGKAGDDGVIVVDARQVERLQKLWFTQTRRPPTDQELDALVQDHVREEVLYREAIRLGLDRDDTIIRRRLAQKMGFLMDDTARIDDPSDAELERFFEANRERYLEPRRTSFRHVYVKRDRPDAEEATAAIGAQLERDPDTNWRGLGDPFMLQREYAERSDAELAELFGGSFTRSLAELQTGSWQGPVESAYGQHLVLVVGRKEPRDPGFESAKPRVRDDFLIDRRRQITGEAYDEIRARYEVIFDLPAAAEPQGEEPP